MEYIILWFYGKRYIKIPFWQQFHCVVGDKETNAPINYHAIIVM